jgi:hypothetical protein
MMHQPRAVRQIPPLGQKLAGTSWKEATWQDMVVARKPQNRFNEEHAEGKG